MCVFLSSKCLHQCRRLCLLEDPWIKLENSIESLFALVRFFITWSLLKGFPENDTRTCNIIWKVIQIFMHSSAMPSRSYYLIFNIAHILDLFVNYKNAPLKSSVMKDHWPTASLLSSEHKAKVADRIHPLSEHSGLLAHIPSHEIQDASNSFGARLPFKKLSSEFWSWVLPIQFSFLPLP